MLCTGQTRYTTKHNKRNTGAVTTSLYTDGKMHHHSTRAYTNNIEDQTTTKKRNTTFPKHARIRFTRCPISVWPPQLPVFIRLLRLDCRCQRFVSFCLCARVRHTVRCVRTAFGSLIAAAFRHDASTPPSPSPPPDRSKWPADKLVELFVVQVSVCVHVVCA